MSHKKNKKKKGREKINECYMTTDIRKIAKMHKVKYQKDGDIKCTSSFRLNDKKQSVSGARQWESVVWRMITVRPVSHT